MKQLQHIRLAVLLKCSFTLFSPETSVVHMLVFYYKSSNSGYNQPKINNFQLEQILYVLMY